MFLRFYSLLNQNKIFEYRLQMLRFNEQCYNEVFIPCLNEFMNDKKINLESFAKSLKIDLHLEKNQEKFLHFLQSIAFKKFFTSNRNMIKEIQVGIEEHIDKMQKYFNIFSLTEDEIIQNNYINEFLDNFLKKLELLKNDEYTRRAKLEEEYTRRAKLKEEKLKREKDKKYDNPENNKNSEDTKKEEDSLIGEFINELNEDEARKKAKNKKKNKKRKIKRQEKKRKLKEEENIKREKDKKYDNPENKKNSEDTKKEEDSLIEKLINELNEDEARKKAKNEKRKIKRQEKKRKLKEEEEENIKREEKIKKLLNRRYFSCPPLDSDYQEIEFYEPKSRFASTEPLVLVEEELHDPFYIEQYKITKNLKTKQTQHKRNNSDSILNTKNNSIDSKEREHSI